MNFVDIQFVKLICPMGMIYYLINRAILEINNNYF